MNAKWSNKQQTRDDKQGIPELNNRVNLCEKTHFLTDAYSVRKHVNSTNKDAVPLWCHLHFTLNLLMSFISHLIEISQSIQLNSLL